jgi:hypothetical protein
MFTLRCSVVVFAFALFLTACGGDQSATEEDSSTPSTSTTSSTTTEEPATLEGRAVKGLVLNAQLDAYILENGSRRHVGSTQTDDQGHFSLQPSDSSGPVVIEMTPAGDGSSTMICDAVDGCGSGSVDFGQEFPLPTDFLISTLIIPSDDTSEVSLTPLTHVAAEWAQAMPGEVSGQKVELARARVAGVFQIDTAFPFHDEPDLTDPQSLDGTDEASARHSLISAAFLERAADTGDTLQDVIDGYTQSLTNYAGQVKNQGTYSLYRLFDAAYEIADTQDILPDIRSSLDLQIAGLSEGVSSTTTSTTYNQQNFDQALLTLDEIDHYLNEAGVNNAGDFLANNAQQVNWLDTAKGHLLINEAPKSMATLVFWTSFIAGHYEEIFNQEAPDQADLNPALKGLSTMYDFTTQELSITGSKEGHTFDITVTLTPITGAETLLDYDVQGHIENSDARLNLDGTLNLDFQDTNIEDAITTMGHLLGGGPSTNEDFENDIKTLAENLNLKATYAGSVSVENLNDPGKAFSLNQVSKTYNWNTAYPDNGSMLTSTTVNTGTFTTPEGDMIGDNGSTADPALDIQIGDSSQMNADFITEAFDLPRMEVALQGTLGKTDSTIEVHSNKLQDYLNSDIPYFAYNDIAEFAGLLPGIDHGSLNMTGSANITIEDMDRGQKTFAFTLDGSRIDASQPNSTDQSFSFHFNGSKGGYITAGDTVVATVTIDSQNLGANLYLVDGTKRGYHLGPLADLASQDVLDAFQLALP